MSSTRVRKVQQIVLQAMSEMLHTDFREESVRITLTDCTMSPDLKDARLLYSVMGDRADEDKATAFFRRYGQMLRQKLKPRLELKFLPRVRFVFNASLKQAVRTLELIDEIDKEDAAKQGPEESAEHADE